MNPFIKQLKREGQVTKVGQSGNKNQASKETNYGSIYNLEAHSLIILTAMQQNRQNVHNNYGIYLQINKNRPVYQIYCSDTIKEKTWKYFIIRIQ